MAAKVRCIPDAGAIVDRRKRLGAFLLSVQYACGAEHGMYKPIDALLYAAPGGRLFWQQRYAVNPTLAPASGIH